MEKLTKALVEAWLETLEVNKSFHFKASLGGQIDPSAYGHLRKIYHDLKKERKVASTGTKEGIYYRVEQVKPIRSLTGGGEDYIDLHFPRAHENDDISEFGFEDLIAISPGDMIVIAGVSNSAKTTLVLNILADNINFPNGCVLMGNEYVTADRVITPRFRRRLKGIDWSPVVDIDGNLKFDLLPIKEHFENHIKKDALNFVDWIAMPSNFYEIQGIHDGIKSSIGKGVGIVVMQKTRGKDYGDGGEFSERLPDIYMKLDFLTDYETILTLGKIKETKRGSGRVSGRTWAFQVNGGIKLRNIREVIKCPMCYGKGWKKMGNSSAPCDNCSKTGYVNR